jgi:3-oxoacyl-[acyl-carrier-protein] synthase II
MARALESANLTTDAIDTIQGAANGGKNPDRIEADALLQLFGPTQVRPAISSIKGALGESFSSGGIRAAALALSIREGKAPPTLGLSVPIAELPFVTGRSREIDIRTGLLNAVSYGGTNVSVVMGKIRDME